MIRFQGHSVCSKVPVVAGSQGPTISKVSAQCELFALFAIEAPFMIRFHSCIVGLPGPCYHL